MARGPLQGFHDYPPPDGGARSEIRRRMRAAARRAGFCELEIPCVESFELYEAKSGEGIAAETWKFEDKGGRAVALVPEETPSLARVFVARGKAEPMPVKWFTVSKNWRYEEPQAGRTREFLQFNLDILGVPGVEAEAELLATASLLLDEVGAEGLYTLRLNDRAVAEALGRRFGASDAPTVFRAVDRFRKVAPAEFLRELERAGVAPERAGELAAWFAEARVGIPPADLPAFFAREPLAGLDDAGRAGVERLGRLVALASALGLADRLVYDPTVVRGLAYYTSSVFEAFAKSGPSRSLFGGGRYDHLIELFGGPATPAAGLAVGDQTLELLLRDAGRWPDGEPPLDTYVVVADAALTPEALRLVGELRRAGLSAETDLLGRSMSRQFKEAARRRSRRALILGLREAPPGGLVERDLATGAQRALSREAAARPA